MASSFSDLGIELMATGENAGTWGTKTNTNLQIVEKAIAGYVEQAVTSGGTTALTITDGDATESTSVARHAVIKLTGTITGNSIVTVPDSIEKVYIVTNGTSGAYTVQFKTASGTGITFGVSEKTTRLVYSDGTNIVDAGFSGASDLEGRELVLDADGDTTITADTDDQIDIKIAGADDFQFTANTFTAQSGSSIVVPEGGLTFGSTAITSTAAELNILDGVTSTAAELNILDGVTSTAAELNILDGVTSTAAELNLLDGITAGTVSASLAVIVDSNKDISGFRNLSITGDLTVAGDDITMGTNTAGNLLVADGTNFNSIAVGSLSEISTVANDDVFLAVDTSGGGLKKITRSAIVSGLASSGAISNVVEDTSPQLGANLDTNSHNILIDDAHFIGDENGNEQIIFQTTSSAVNQFDVTNAATGNPPSIKATGGDTNIDFNISAKGTGHVTVLGDTNSGAIQFNCENNSHGQILKAQPHSASVTNEMLLPDGADSTLVSLVATQTLTNKTLTTPVIAEIDSLSSGNITLDAEADIILDADGADIIFKDAGTSIATFTNSSTDFIIESATSDKDIIFKVNDGGSSTEVARFDGDVSALLMASGKKIMLGAAEETISGDGTDITFEVGSSGDINIPANIGLTFGDDGEKIEGDGTDLTITGNNINLTATADVVIPANVGITFGSGEKIEGDSTDLTITSGAKINLTATSDVHIPNNVGIVFGGDSEKIEGDGTDMTISANNLTVDAAADIVLDAAGNNVTFKSGGTSILDISNSSSDAVITSSVQDKDIIFKGDDGGSAVTALTMDMSAGGTSIFGAAAFNQEATLTDASTISWDVAASPVAKVTLGANRTLGAGSNAVAGQFVSLLVIQDGTGSRTLSFNAAYEFTADTAPTLTTTASKGDLFVFRYNGSKFLEVGRNLNLTLS